MIYATLIAAGIALVGTYLIKLYLDWHAARAIVRARLQEIRNLRYDFRVYENSWKSRRG